MQGNVNVCVCVCALCDNKRVFFRWACLGAAARSVLPADSLCQSIIQMAAPGVSVRE